MKTLKTAGLWAAIAAFIAAGCSSGFKVSGGSGGGGNSEAPPVEEDAGAPTEALSPSELEALRTKAQIFGTVFASTAGNSEVIAANATVEVVQINYQTRQVTLLRTVDVDANGYYEIEPVDVSADVILVAMAFDENDNSIGQMTFPIETYLHLTTAAGVLRLRGDINEAVSIGHSAVINAGIRPGSVTVDQFKEVVDLAQMVIDSIGSAILSMDLAKLKETVLNDPDFVSKFEEIFAKNDKVNGDLDVPACFPNCVRFDKLVPANLQELLGLAQPPPVQAGSDPIEVVGPQLLDDDEIEIEDEELSGEITTVEVSLERLNGTNGAVEECYDFFSSRWGACPAANTIRVEDGEWELEFDSAALQHSQRHQFVVKAMNATGLARAMRTYRFLWLGVGPTATLANVPAADTNVTSASIEVGGDNVTTYSLKFGAAGSTNCAADNGYSSATAVSEAFIPNTSGDGDYRLCVVGIDLAGNRQATATVANWTLDTAAPSVDAGPDAAGFATTNLNGSATDANDIVEYLWERVAGPGSATFGDRNAAVTTFAGTANGVYTLRLTATDAAGNAGTDTVDINYALTNPVVTIDGPLAAVNLANESAYTVTGGCSINGQPVSLVVTDSGAGNSAAAPTCAAGLWSQTFDLSGLAEGAINVQADHNDGGGNNAPQVNEATVKDTAIPTLTLTTPLPQITAVNETMYTVAGTCSENGQTVTITADDANGGTAPAVGNDTCTGGSFSVDLDVSGLDEGTLTFTGEHADAALNPISDADNANKDTISPAVAITTPLATINAANAATYAVSGTCTENGVNVAVGASDGGAPITENFVCASSAWNVTFNLSALTPGTINFTADHDVATQDTANATLDVAAVLTNNALSPINDANDQSYAFSGTCEDDGIGNVAYSLDDTNGGTAAIANTVDCSGGTWSVTGLDVSSLDDDTLTLTLDYSDDAGNPIQLTPSVGKDTVASFTNNALAALNGTNAGSYSVSGNCEDDGAANVSYSIDDVSGNGPIAGTAACAGGSYSISALNLSGLADEAITFTLDYTDDEGNAVQLTPSTAKDTTATFTNNALANLNSASEAMYALSGSCEDDGTNNVTYSIDDVSGNGPVDGTVNCTGGSYSIGGLNLSGLADEVVTFTLDYTDDEGNAVQLTPSTTKDTAVTFTNNALATLNAASDGSYGLTGTCEDDGLNRVAYSIDDVSGNGPVAGTADCTGGSYSISTLNLSGLADETITFTLEYADDAGNTSQLTPSTPKDAAVTFTNGALAALNDASDNSYSFSGTCEDDGVNRVAYSIDDVTGNGPIAGTVDCSGGAFNVASVNLSTLADELITFTLDYTDDEGNAAQLTPSTAKDTVASFSNNALAALNSGSEGSYSLSGSCEDDGSNNVAYSIDDVSGNGPVAGTVNCAGGAFSISSLNLSSLADEVITFTLDYTDDEGNSAQLTPSTAKDTVVTFTNGALSTINSSNAGTYSFSGSCEDDGTNNVAYSIDDVSGNGPVAGTVNCAGGSYSVASVNLSGLADENITFTLDYTDDEGNSAQLTPSVAKDAIVSFTVNSLVAINAANDNSYGFSGSCEDDGTNNVAYSIDDVSGNGPIAGTVNCAGGSYSVSGVNLTGLADETITVSMSYTDDEGNSATPAPTTSKDTVVTFTNNALSNVNNTNDSGYSLSGSCEDDGTNNVAYSIDDVSGNGPVAGTVNCTGGSYTISALNLSGLADETITFTLDYTDDAGNPAQLTPTASKETTITFTNNALASVLVANVSTYGFSGSCEDDGTNNVAYSIDDVSGNGPIAGTLNCTGGSYSATGLNLSALADETITVTLDYTDDEGNEAQLLPTAPKDTGLTFTNNALTVINSGNEGMYSLTGDCEDDGAGRVSYSIDDVSGNGPIAGTLNCTGGSYSITTLNLSSLADENVTFTLGYTDDEGNPGTLTPSVAKDTVVTFTNGALSAINAANAGSYSVSGSCEDDGTNNVNYSIDDVSGNGPIAGSVNCTGGSYSISALNLSSLADENITFTLSYSDDEGNLAQLTPSSGKDIVASLSNNALAALNSSNANNYSLSGTCEDDGTNNVDYSIDDVSGNGPIAGSVNCSGGSFSISGLNLTGLADEVITFTLDYDDDEGNSATTLSPTTAKDTVAGFSNNALATLNSGSEGSYSLSGSCEDDGTNNVAYSIDDVSGNGPVAGTVNCSGGSFSISTLNLSGLADEVVTFTLDYTDSEGNSAQLTPNTAKDTAVTFTNNALATLNSGSEGSYSVSGNCEDDGTNNVAYSIDDVSGNGPVAGTVNCAGGSYSITGLNLSGLADELITFTLDYTDDEGNASQLTPSTAKDSAVTFTNSGLTAINSLNEGAYSLAGNCEDDGVNRVAYSIDDVSGNGPIAGTVNCAGGGYSISAVNLGSLADENITFTLDYTDDEGNSAQLTPSVAKDTVASFGNSALAAMNSTNASSYNFDGTCEDDGSNNVSYSIDDVSGNGPIAGTLNCSGGTWSATGVNLSGLAEESITFTLNYTDDEGNAATTLTPSTAKDTVVTFTNNALSAINSGNVATYSMTGSCEDDGAGRVAYSIDDVSGNGPIAGTVNCSGGSYTVGPINLSSLADETITFSLDYTDDEGNAASTLTPSASKDVGVTFTNNALSNLNATSDGSYSLSGSCEDDGVGRVAYSIDDVSGNGPVAGTVDCSGGSYTISGLNLSGLADEVITFTLDYTDDESNPAQLTPSTTKDTVASFSNNALSAINSGNAGSYSLSGNCEDDGTNNVDYSIDDVSGNGPITGSVNCAGGAFTISGLNLTGLADETITFTLDYDDDEGNSAPNLTPSIAKDTVAAFSNNALAALTSANAGSYSLSGSCEDDGTNNVNYSIDDVSGNGPIAGSVNCSGGSFSITGLNLTGLADETITFTLDYDDAEGNSATTLTPSTAKDTVASFSNNALAAMNSGNAGSYSLSGSCEDDGTNNVDYSIDDVSGNGPITGSVNCTGGSFSISGLNLSGLADETITFTLDYDDAEGNSATTLTPSTAKDTVASFANNALGAINAGNAGTYSMTGSCEDDGTNNVDYSIDDVSGNGPIAGSVNCTGGSYTVGPVNLTGLADETITFTLDYDDAEGNSATTLTPSIGKDTVASFSNNALAALTSANAGSYSLSGSCEDDGTNNVDYSIDDVSGNGPIAGSVNCSGGSYTISGLNLTGLADETITFTLDYDDAEGNSATTLTPSTAKDTVASFSNNALAALNSGNESNYSLGGSCEDDGTNNVDYSIDDVTGNGPITGSVNCTGGSFSISGLNLSGLADETITFTLDYDDAEGNSATTLTPSTAKDTVVTFTANIIANINAGNASAYGFTGTCEDDGTNNVAYSVDDVSGNGPVSGTVNCTGGAYTVSPINLSGLADETITFTLDYTDDEGNSVQLTPTRSKDTVASFSNNALAALTSANAGSYSLSGSCEDDGTNNVDYSIDDVSGNGPITGNVNCTGGSFSITGLNLTGLADETITFTLDYDDDEGNSATTLTPSTAKDTVASFSNNALAALNSGNESSYSLGGSCEDDGTNNVDYSIDDVSGNGPITGSVNCTGGSFTISGLNLSGLADETITFTLDYDDAEGNSATTLTPSTAKDTVASFSNNALSAINSGSAGSYSVTGSCEDDGTNNVDYSIDDVTGNGPITGSVNCTGGSYTVGPINLGSLADESITFTLDYDDAEGNSATTLTPSIGKDTVASFSNNALSAMNSGNAGSYSMTGSCEDNGTNNVDYSIDDVSGNGPIAGSVNCTGGSYTVGPVNLSSLADETITFTLDYDDDEGNSATTLTPSVAKDTVAIFSNNALAALNSTNDGSYSLSGSCEDDGTNNVDYSIDDVSGNGPITGSVNCTGGSFTISSLNLSGLADETITFTLDYDDAEGNSATTLTPSTVKDTAVTFTNNALSAINSGNQTNYSFGGTCEDDGTNNVDYSIDDAANGGTSPVTGSVNCSGGNYTVSSVNLSSLDNGTITFTLDYTDDEGNAAQLTPTATKTTNTAPSWTSAAGDGVFSTFTGSGTGPYTIALDELTTGTITVTASDGEGDDLYVSCTTTGETWVTGFGSANDFTISVAPGAGVGTSGGDNSNGTGSFTCDVDDGALSTATVTFNYTVNVPTPKNFGTMTSSSSNMPAGSLVKMSHMEAAASANGHYMAVGFDSDHATDDNAAVYCHYTTSWSCGKWTYNYDSGAQAASRSHDVQADDHGNFFVAIYDTFASNDWRVKVRRYCNGANGYAGCSSGGWTDLGYVVSNSISDVNNWAKLALGVSQDGDHVAVAYEDATSGTAQGEIRVARWTPDSGWCAEEDPDNISGDSSPNQVSGGGYVAWGVVGTNDAATNHLRQLDMANNGDFWVAVAGDSQQDIWVRRYSFTGSNASCASTGSWDGNGLTQVHNGSTAAVTMMAMSVNKTDSDEVVMVFNNGEGDWLAETRSSGGTWTADTVATGITDDTFGPVYMNSSGDWMTAWFDHVAFTAQTFDTRRRVSGSLQTTTNHDPTGAFLITMIDLTYGDNGEGSVAFGHYYDQGGNILVGAFRYVSSSWQSQQTLGATIDGAGWPIDFATASDGTGAVVWNNGNSDFIKGSYFEAVPYD